MPNLNTDRSFSKKWLSHFQKHAFAASDSVKEQTKVGAVLIGNHNEVLLTAFNGPPIGIRDSGGRRSRTNGLKYRFSSHAEQNLINFAARNGIKTEGLAVYVTHVPCSNCAKAIVQAGINCVIIGHGAYASQTPEDTDAVNDMFAETATQVILHHSDDNVVRADMYAHAILYATEIPHVGNLYYHAKRASQYLPDFPLVILQHIEIAILLANATHKYDSQAGALSSAIGKTHVRDANLAYTYGSGFKYAHDYNYEPIPLIAAIALLTDLIDDNHYFDATDDVKPVLAQYVRVRLDLIDTLRTDQTIRKWLDDRNFYIGSSGKLFHPNPFHYDF